MSVLKLSTIWNMTKVCRILGPELSTNAPYSLTKSGSMRSNRLSTVSPVDKILLARAHRVLGWLEDAITSLTSDDSQATLEDLATIGWETAARILWIIKSSPSLSTSNTLCFRTSAIKCGSYSPSSLINPAINPAINCIGCARPLYADTELIYPCFILGTDSDLLVAVNKIQCKKCGSNSQRIQHIYLTSTAIPAWPLPSTLVK